MVTDSIHIFYGVNFCEQPDGGGSRRPEGLTSAIFVDDVDLLALLNIFNQHHQLLCLHFHCPHDKSQKLSHLQPDQACRQREHDQAGTKEKHPIYKDVFFKDPGIFMKSAEKVIKHL